MAEQQEPAGSPTDLMAQWQESIKNWQQSFEALATSYARQVSDLWRPVAGTEASDVQTRWRAVIADYVTKAQPYQEEMIDALRTLTSSWPDPFKSAGEAMVTMAERGFEAERQLLERLAPPTAGTE